MAMTVKELYKYCEEQIQKGNAEKEIMISNDDEGNGYHSLGYQFTDDAETLEQIQACVGLSADINKIVILG